MVSENIYNSVFSLAIRVLQKQMADSNIPVGLRRMVRFVEFDCEIDSGGMWEYFSGKASETTGEVTEIHQLIDDFNLIGAHDAVKFLKEGHDCFRRFASWRIANPQEGLQDPHWTNAMNFMNEIESQYRMKRPSIECDIGEYISGNIDEFRLPGVAFE